MKRYSKLLAGTAALIAINVTAVVAVGLPTGGPVQPAQAATAGMSMAGMSMGSISLLSPVGGTTITANTLTVKIAVKDFTLSCAQAGKAPRAGIGHWHLLLDGALVNMYCGASTTLSMQNVAPGVHQLEVMLAANNHMGMMAKDQAIMTTFTYRPARPLAALTAVTPAGKPTISIVSPARSATVGERFQIQLSWSNFTPSCDLLGKKNVTGYGHWHLNFDSMSGPMMGMGTMVAMGCTHTYTVFTDGLKPGKHTLYALLVDNQHAPLMPMVAASITVNVK